MAYKYSESTNALMRRICTPIHHLGMNVFGYMRIFPNGQYLSLCNDLAWKKFYFLNVEEKFLLDHSLTYDDAKRGHLTNVMWPKTPNSTIAKYLYDHDIWNGVQYVKYSKRYFELWAFCTNRNNFLAQEMCYRNAKHLFEFIDYFNSTDLLKDSRKNSECLASYRQVNLPKLYCNNEEKMVVENFLKEIKMDKAKVLVSHGKSFVLTKRETQCLICLGNGYSQKEIARKLGLSTRTVEIYVKNIKLKSDCNDGFSLIKLYEDNYLNLLG